ncbi:MAG TPA: A24 family peptidase, partial [Arenimonas sp.]|nr:A24 family peptidase [Arenimonas sp.]
WKFGPSLEGLAAMGFTACLISLAGIDVRTQYLPDDITLPLLWLGLTLSLVPLFQDPWHAVMGAAVGYLSLWSVYKLFKLVTGKEGMGYGDFKLLAALGAWCGPKSILTIVLLSSFIGAIIGSIYLAIKGRDNSTPIPFGPYLAAAGWVQFILGMDLIAAYMHWAMPT